MHFAIGIQDMGRFGQYGMVVLYSPGLITAMFGFLPIGIGLAVELFKPASKPRPTVLQWIMGVAAMFALAFLLISLPEMLLQDENSPYKFTDRGFYEQYSQQYELDNDYDY